MQIQIKPHTHNTFPLRGILIETSEVREWILEIQNLQLDFKMLQVYPIPDNVPNTIWGCLVVLSKAQKIEKIALQEYCQLVENTLFIPENSILSPYLSKQEIKDLFKNNYHIFHPEFGLVELTEQVDWQNILENPKSLDINFKQPQSSVFIPKEVKSFQIQAVEPEEIIEDLENQFKTSGDEDKPLSLFEKGKLAFYQKFFKEDKDSNTSFKDFGGSGSGFGGLGGGWLSKLFGGSGSGFGGGGSGFSGGWFGGSSNSNWIENMRADFEDLEKRSQKQIDKLMDLLKNNPEEAMKYAIPLDEEGTSRGGFSSDSSFELFKRWNNFSLFSSDKFSSGGGGSIDLGKNFHKLQEQYRKTAEALIKKGEYRKAAFIYIKLLKDYHKAAETLQKGKLYEDAASVYLKYLKDKKSAAECYEKGLFTEKAIELYKELKMYEKVGDLYMSLGQITKSHIYYELLVDDYKSRSQFIKASLIYKDKMHMPEKGQSLLLEGWEKNLDAFNCLNNYFNNISDEKKLGKEIQHLSEKLEPHQHQNFLKVLNYEFKKQNTLSKNIRNIAYDIISLEIKKNPQMTSELLNFNSNDKELVKDTIRFRGKKQ